MRTIAVLVAIIVLSVSWIGSRAESAVDIAPGRIVDTSEHDYTYEEMLDDLEQLAVRYPDYIRWSVADTSLEGRGIPIVRLGRDDAPCHMMIQATMHAREHMSTHLVMVMIEGTAWKRMHGVSHEGLRIYDILDKIQLTVLPMVNPDGVEICQRGAEGCRLDETRRWVEEMAARGVSHRQIKSNARGVDLNRNFTNGHGRAFNAVRSKHFYHYPGHQPLTEPEVKAMMQTLIQRPYDLCLNYHTSGNIVYYGCGNAPDSVNSRARRMARVIGKRTRYPLYGPEVSERPNGSWADEVELNFGVPSATVELGSRNPVPQRELSGLLRRNGETWLDLILDIERSKGITVN